MIISVLTVLGILDIRKVNANTVILDTFSMVHYNVLKKPQQKILDAQHKPTKSQLNK
jgi:uncharacterized protein YkvS